MDIPKLLLGIALIAGYMVLRLGWTYKQDAASRSKKKGLGGQVESVLLLLLGVVMLAAGLYFILLAMSS
jgi:hypothetical protein